MSTSESQPENETGANVSNLADLPSTVKWLAVIASLITYFGIFGFPFVPRLTWGPFYYWPALFVAVPIFVAAWRLIPSHVPETEQTP